MNETITNEEIIAADLEFKSNHTMNDLQSIGERLEQIEEQISSNICEASKQDYALSIASGVLAGAIDSLYVGRISIGKDDIVLSHEGTNRFIQGYAKFHGCDKPHLKDTIRALEEKFPVPQDNIWKGKELKISAKNHHLADLAHHPTPLGLASAVLVQFLRVGSFVNREGKWHFVPVAAKKTDLIKVYAPAVITGLLHWIFSLSRDVIEEKTGKDIPDAVLKIARLAATTPLIVEILQVADRWFGHLVSDMGGSKNTAGEGTGIPGIFISLLYEIASLPVLKDTELPKIINRLYQKEKVDLRHEIPVYKAIGKQTVPVILNELFVRTFFFVSRLAAEVNLKKDIRNVSWEKVIPIHNRTVDRMLLVSGMTFTFADTIDAAVRAAVESGGSWVVFGVKFASRFNYVGAGRAAVSVVKEISNESKEAQLLHEKRLLSEEKASIVLPMLQQYKKELTHMISSDLAEDLENYMNGLTEIDKGLKSGSTDSVICGSVIIQRKLGKDVQFTNQDEFDAFMNSDDALQF